MAGMLKSRPRAGRSPDAFGSRAADVAQPLAAGLVTAVVGFSGSFTLVLTGLRNVGADQGQAVSGLLVLCLAMCGLSVWLGLRHRQPISIAWSTPGAAVLIGAEHHSGGYAHAVGAFLLSGLLITATGAWGRLGRRLLTVPEPLAMALLAGILFSLCLAPARAAVESPLAVLPVLVVWALLTRYARRWAVPGALAAAVGGLLFHHDGSLGLAGDLVPRLEFTAPAFSVSAVLGLTVPLYVITMAAQNLPGLAVLGHFGYRPPTREILLSTGATTGLAAAGGGFMLNLAASTAALVAGPHAHRDPGQRWIASVSTAVAYAGFGLAAGVFAGLIAMAPPLLFQAVAGLALLETFGSALATALSRAGAVPSAAITFVVTASGISVLGVGSALWGLLAGLAAYRFLPSPERLRSDQNSGSGGKEYEGGESCEAAR